MAVLLLLHVPPDVVLNNDVVAPWQTLIVPKMTDGTGVTVTMAVREQPVERAYVITDVPGITPVTTPDVRSTVAIDGLLLVHVPPAEALLSAVVEPSHTEVVPAISAGRALLVTSTNVLHPVDSV
jgi:hypothetical protein